MSMKVSAMFTMDHVLYWYLALPTYTEPQLNGLSSYFRYLINTSDVVKIPIVLHTDRAEPRDQTCVIKACCAALREDFHPDKSCSEAAHACNGRLLPARSGERGYSKGPAWKITCLTHHGCVATGWKMKANT